MTLNIFLFAFSLTGLVIFLASRLFRREGEEEMLARSDERIREMYADFLKRLAFFLAFLLEKLQELRPKLIRAGLIALLFALKIARKLWLKIKNRGMGEKRGSVSFYLKSVSEYKRDRDN